MQKELQVKMSSKRPGCYEVFYEGGGELPAELTGAWTNPTKAQMAVDVYLSKRDKGTKRGNRSNQSRTD